MGSWRIELRSGNSVATIDLIDTPGPLNDWTCSTAGAFDPSQGGFTNQTGDVVPTNQPSWLLRHFDIDTVAVGDTGPAEVLDSGGTFPGGNMPWTVIQQL
jgi:hypothetical protein